jgi:cold shock CspA family protein
MKQVGVVKHFIKDKGYGFIGRKDKQDIYFHLAKCAGVDYKTGDLVEFEESTNARGEIAINVKHSDSHNY